MSYATIMVLLDPSRRSHHRLAIAAQMAAEHNAALIGMLACQRPDPAWVYRLPDGARHLEAIRVQHEQDCEVMRRAFDRATEALPISAQWHDFDGLPLIVGQREARLADLLIVGQEDQHDPAAFVAVGFVESIVLGSGRPVLVIPRVGRFSSVGGRVLVGWNGSREAARAISDALPFLRRAHAVTLVSCSLAGKSGDEWSTPPEYAVTWLAAHGVSANVHSLTVTAPADIGERLLSEAADLETGLIVAGAYGHSRFRELVLGGATRTLLSCMTVPVLFSH
jgi:nucleotide-binding universal stress UspA family protein